MTAVLKTTTRFNSARLRQLVDQLGNINAEIAELQHEADGIKARLIASGQERIEGSIFQAAIFNGVRTSVDSKRVREMLGDLTPMTSTAYVGVRLSDRSAK